MKKVILIPDSFKGTLSSAQLCELMGETIRKNFPKCEVTAIPVADGGEGSVDCFLAALGGERISAVVKNPFYEDMNAFYGVVNEGSTAVIEMAVCAGLPLAGARRDPCITTTYGVGQLMLDAAQRGVKKMIVGLGGSSTNDGGCGAAAAAGVRFFNRKGETFIPVGGTLHEIERIDLSGRAPILEAVEIITMCDIDNPMYGQTGASHIFGPQKGASPEMVLFLDEGMKHLAESIKKDLKQDLADIPGTGAAGAMGAGMLAFFHSKLQMGIEAVLDTVRFQEMIKDADMIFTGEGKLDSQSLRGKVVIGVAKRAKEQGVPVTAVVGGADYHIEGAYEQGVTSIFSINRLPEDFEVSRQRSEENMRFAMDNLMRLIKSVKN